MRAPVAAVAAPAAVSVVVAAAGAVAARLVAVLLLLRAVAVEPGEDGGEGEEDAVHDAEGEGGLEHGARLVGADVEAVDAGRPEDAEADVPPVARDDVGAVGARDEAQVVDGGDEGAEEAQVDQSHEARVGAAAVVAEEGEQRPDEAQNRHDKHDEDEVRRQDVVAGVAVYEVAQHAHGWYLEIGERRQSASPNLARSSK